jgi:hypothetical protein
MVSKILKRTFAIAVLSLLGTEQAMGQQVAPLRPSVLFQATPSAAPVIRLASDSVQGERVQNAILWGVLGGLIGFIITSDADGAAIPRMPIVPLLAITGAVAGYVTAGKGGN